MDKLNLYEITTEMALIEKALYESLDQETGEVDTALAEAFKNAQVKYEEKLKGCVYMIQTFEDKLDLIKKEIDRLEKIKKVLENRDESIRNLIANNVEVGKKIDLGLHTISWRKSDAVIIEDENKIPQEYKDIIPETTKPNKTKIKEAIKGGKEVQGARLENRNNLQIK